MGQIHEQQKTHDHEGRNTNLQLGHQLFKENIQVTHLLEPEKVTYEIHKRQEDRAYHHYDGHDQQDLVLELLSCFIH